MSRRRLPPSQANARTSISSSSGTNAVPTSNSAAISRMNNTTLPSLSRTPSTSLSQHGIRHDTPTDFEEECDPPAATSSASFQMPRFLMDDPKKVYQLYMQSQENVIQLEAEILKLKAQLAESEVRFIGASSKVRTEALRQAVNQIADQDPAVLDAKTIMMLVNKLGSNFQVFFSPFLNLSHFTTARPDFGAYDLERYATNGNQALGVTAELYECIPTKYHDLLLSPSSELFSERYTKAFRKAGMTSRSNSLKDLRGAAAAIFDLPAEYFKSESAKLRGEIPEICKLLGRGYDDDGNFTYMRIAPVMCLDGDTFNANKYFLGPCLFKIARTVLFGKTAADNADRAVSRSVSQYLRTDIVPEVSFGLIAWVSMMARYLLSTDVQFENNGIGAQTKIHYGDDYNFYKRHLIEYYHGADTTTLIVDLLETWDREVFSIHNKRKGHLGDDDDEVIDMDADPDPDASEIAASMARLRLQMATQSNTPDVDPPVTERQPIPQPFAFEETENSDDDFYGDEVPPALEAENLPAAPAPNAAVNPPSVTAASPDPGLIPRQATSREESVHDSDGHPSESSIDPNPTTITGHPPPKSRQAAKIAAPVIPKATRSRAIRMRPNDEPSDKIVNDSDIIDIAPSQLDNSIPNVPAAKPKRGRGANSRKPGNA